MNIMPPSQNLAPMRLKMSSRVTFAAESEHASSVAKGDGDDDFKQFESEKPSQKD